MITRPKKVEKLWGYELWIHNDSQYCGKLLVFPNEGNHFSMHYHMIKNETWYVQEGAFEFHWIDTEDGKLNKKILIKRTNQKNLNICSKMRIVSLFGNTI